MACINPDGTLTPSAEAVLSALSLPLAPEELAESIELPVFRIRSSVREMLEAGLVEEKEGKYVVTKLGQAKIKR